MRAATPAWKRQEQPDDGEQPEEAGAAEAAPEKPYPTEATFLVQNGAPRVDF